MADSATVPPLGQGPMTSRRDPRYEVTLYRYVGVPGSHTLEFYRSHGGYEAARKALTTMTPEQVVDEVKGVMSFYSTYHEHPVGRYHLQVCATLSCALAGADEMYDHLVEELGIVNGERDREGRFSVQKVECLGSCGTAPVLQVNDTFYERVTRSRCRYLIEALRRDEVPEPWRERGGDNEGADKAAPLAADAAGGGAPATRAEGGEG